MSNTPLETALLAQAEKMSSTQKVGFQEGYEAARRELEPKITKIASDVVEQVIGDERENEAFRGKVAAHAAAAELTRAKQSMEDGLCWDCGTAPFTKTSKYRRCGTCDANDTDEAPR